MKPTKQTKEDKQPKLTNFLNSRLITRPPINPNQNSKPKVNDQHQIKRQRERSSNSHQSNHSNRSRSNHSRTESLSSSLSALSHSPSIPNKNQPPPPLQSKPHEKVHVNVDFYLNKAPSRPNGEFIEKMLATWHSDYERLQRDHSFIQWIFPNSFQSRFNYHARPLSLQEADIFKQNPQILDRYIRSYNMMLGFYGMKLKNKMTGELVRSRNPDYKQRYYKTLLTSFHNHMRITRILCSLTELGFVGYATELCKFLKQEIYAPSGALQSLAKYNVYEQWKPFEKGEEDAKNTNIYMIKLKKNGKMTIREKAEEKKEKKQTEEKGKQKESEGVSLAKDS